MTDWEEQDERIKELDRIMPPSQTGLIGGWERRDWRPISQLISEIGASFKLVRYPTSQQKHAAWERYAALRDAANKRRNAERDGFAGQSSWYRSAVLDKCKGLTWSPIDDIIFFFDPATADEMRACGESLRSAVQFYNEVKHLMLREDRELCRQRFDEVRASHDRFWGRCREANDRKQQEWQERKHERQARKQEMIQRIRANLQKNYERLEKAKAARGRVQAHMEETQAKLAETSSAKWQGIFQEWIDQDQKKLDDIDESIEQVQRWINEDESRLREFER